MLGLKRAEAGSEMLSAKKKKRSVDTATARVPSSP